MTGLVLNFEFLWIELARIVSHQNLSLETKSRGRYSYFKMTGLSLNSYYRVIQAKLDETKQLFQTENMHRFWIQWYFYYRKWGKFYMKTQKFRKKSHKSFKMSVKLRFPILKFLFSSNFYLLYVMILTEILSAFWVCFLNFVVSYKISLICDNKNTIGFEIYACFLSEIAV